MTVKKTFRMSELRSTQIDIMSDFLKSKGFKGSQTEIVDKALMEFYFAMRRTDFYFFEKKESEIFGQDKYISILSKNIREG